MEKENDVTFVLKTHSSSSTQVAKQAARNSYAAEFVELMFKKK